jgi:hypothetical protein
MTGPRIWIDRPKIHKILLGNTIISREKAVASASAVGGAGNKDHPGTKSAGGERSQSAKTSTESHHAAGCGACGGGSDQ